MRSHISLTAVFALLALSSSPFTNAQITTLYGVQSVFIEGKGLYIHGGRVSDPSTTEKSPDSGQTFVISLNTTWEAESPSIRPLPTMYPSGGIGSTLFNNKKSWFLKDTDSVHIFDIEAETWAPEKIDSNVNPHPALGAIAVPTANDYVYVINGYKNATDLNASPLMMRFNVQTQSVEPMHAAMNVADSHSIVWSTQKNSAFIYGGENAPEQSLVEFFPSDPAKITSIQRNILGDIPESRFGHCMVEAYGGKQFYVFGGATKQGTTSDIYRIDVDTMKWTRLKSGPSAAARAYMACAVTNDMFIAWGGATWDGTNSRYQVVTTPLVVFNLRSGEWQSTFDPTPASNGTAPPSDTPAPESETPVAAIVGGAAGALLLVGAGVGFLVYRRKQTRRGLPFIKVSDDGDDDNNHDNTHGSSKRGINPSSSPPAYKMSHLHDSTGHGGAEFNQQQQQYHQQHPYQEQQHYYQQEPLLDPFADSAAAAEYNTKVENGSSPFGDSGMHAPPPPPPTTTTFSGAPGGDFSPQPFAAANPFVSPQDTDYRSVKVDVTDYARPTLGAQRHSRMGEYPQTSTTIKNMAFP
ncbi:hypothetical protein EC991_009459 [Linnemannia zychae]|nr:hypothetical protein EC991_009459 [Linnemannia zychae]